MKAIPSKFISQILILLILFVLGALIFKEMLPYLSGVLGAVTLYVLLRGFMIKLQRKGWKKGIAASFLMVLSFFCILVPIAGFVLIVVNKIGKATKNSERLISVLKSQIAEWEGNLGFDLSSQIDSAKVSSSMTKVLQELAGGTATSLVAIGIMYFLLYYMLTERKIFQESLVRFAPIELNNLKIVGNEIRSMVRSNAIGIPLVAIAQGIVGLIGFLIFGINDPFFWAFVVTIGSMVPFVGAFLGVAPVFIIALADGDMVQAWGILIYGLAIIGTTDNIIRLFILKKLDDVHPLVTLLGVIIGVPIFGFIGLIFGPILINLFLIMIKIYQQEYGGKSQSK